MFQTYSRENTQANADSAISYLQFAHQIGPCFSEFCGAGSRSKANAEYSRLHIEKNGCFSPAKRIETQAREAMAHFESGFSMHNF
jgi:cell division protein FtsL